MAIRPCTKLLSVILNPIINDEESRLCRTSFVMARHAVPLQFTIIHSIFRYADIDSICRCVCRLCRRISVFLFTFGWFGQTVITGLRVTADYVAAFGTFPFFRFFCQELIHALFFYEIQVIDHAYVILPVALIEALQPRAGKVRTFIAVLY